MDEEKALKKQRIRERVVDELISTERSYLKHMTALKESFRAPLLNLAQRGKIGTMEEIEALFCGDALDSIVTNHEMLLAALAARDVGGAILRHAQQHRFRCYTVYCARYPRAVALLESLQQRKKFRKALDKITAKESASLPLEALLIMPIQRPPRYELLLREIMKQSPGDQPEPALRDAFAKVQQVVVMINEARRALEKRAEVFRLQQRISNWPVAELGDGLGAGGERVLLKSGELRHHSKQYTRRSKTLRFHLLSDVLLWTTKKHQYRFYFNLLTVQCFQRADDPRMFALKSELEDDLDETSTSVSSRSSRGKEKNRPVMRLQAATEEDATAWIDAIIEARNKLEFKRKQRRREQMKSMDFAVDIDEINTPDDLDSTWTSPAPSPSSSAAEEVKPKKSRRRRWMGTISRRTWRSRDAEELFAGTIAEEHADSDDDDVAEPPSAESTNAADDAGTSVDTCPGETPESGPGAKDGGDNSAGVALPIGGIADAEASSKNTAADTAESDKDPALDDDEEDAQFLSMLAARSSKSQLTRKRVSLQPKTTSLGTLKVKILGVRSLPSLERQERLPLPYVKLQVTQVTGIELSHKTDTASEPGADHRFDDEEPFVFLRIPLSSPLVVTVFDRDRLDVDDSLGRVEIELARFSADVRRDFETQAWFTVDPRHDSKVQLHIEFQVTAVIDDTAAKAHTARQMRTWRRQRTPAAAGVGARASEEAAAIDASTLIDGIDDIDDDVLEAETPAEGTAEVTPAVTEVTPEVAEVIKVTEVTPEVTEVIKVAEVAEVTTAETEGTDDVADSADDTVLAGQSESQQCQSQHGAFEQSQQQGESESTPTEQSSEQAVLPQPSFESEQRAQSEPPVTPTPVKTPTSETPSAEAPPTETPSADVTPTETPPTDTTPSTVEQHTEQQQQHPQRTLKSVPALPIEPPTKPTRAQQLQRQTSYPQSPLARIMKDYESALARREARDQRIRVLERIVEKGGVRGRVAKFEMDVLLRERENDEREEITRAARRRLLQRDNGNGRSLLRKD